MAKNFFNRYIWLIDTINRHGHITLKEISNLWEISSLNETGKELKERTFHHHREAILDTFGIEIKCDRSLVYYLANSGDIGDDEVRQWLLDSLALNNLLNESSGMKDKILVESIPSSQKWLTLIVNSMKEGKTLEISYQSFWNTEPSIFEVHPLCLKLFRQRWYLLAKSEGFDQPRVYALDRILEIRQLKNKLKIPRKFNASEFFLNHYGVSVSQDSKPEHVRIKVEESQVKYLETLPLHRTQKVVEQTDSHAVFDFFIVPTFEFKQEILSRGPFVEVLSPEWFREEIKEDIAEMAKNYGLKKL